MKVAFIHNLLGGGARRTMDEHMRRLDGESLELCLETAAPVSDEAIVVPLRMVAPKLRNILRPPARYRDLAASLCAWKRLSVLVDEFEPDVVVAHPCQFFQCPPAVRHVNARTLYFCHEYRRVDYEPVAHASRRKRTRLLYAPLYAAERRTDARAVAGATALVTNSRFTAAGIKHAYGRDARVIRLGVADAFCPPSSPITARHVLSVGTMIPSKGHDLAILAAARARRRWPVVVVAPRSNESELARLRRLAEDSGVQLDVRIGISDLELRELYRAAVATLYLALAEPLGLAALEAQACGCPVIVSADGGLPETVLDGRSGWAVPRDPAFAAGRLDQLEDEDRRSSFAVQAALHGGGFSWENSARDLERVLWASLGQTPP